MDHDRDSDPESISIVRCREILGDDAARLSDDEVEQIRRHADVIARVIVEIFRDRERYRGRE